MKAKTIEERVAEEVRKNTLLLEKAYKEELLRQLERIWDAAVAQIRAWMPRLMRGLVAVRL